MNKYRLQFHYIDPYTWEWKPKDITISIRNKKAARKWVKQSYNKPSWHINVKKVNNETQ